jgi:PPK2 family polyphosphate:nucleotide phosphotransferase
VIREDIIDLFRIPAGKTVRLKDYDPGWSQTDEMKELGKDEIKERARRTLDQNLTDLAQAQDLLYADDRYSVLIILQAMDAAGKDGTIKHVMSGVNPQGCQVFSFKKPSAEDLDHNFLWRYMRCLPERGRIGIFNRSYFEDVLVVRVHPELLAAQRLPGGTGKKKFWRRRYQDINAFERHLFRNGTVVLKFFLNVSKDEQKRRFLERLDRPDKNWKFSASDLAERAHWGRYMRAYSDCLSATSTKWAPWYVVPADHKWVARAVVADVITATLRSLDLKYPEVTDDQRASLVAAKRDLLAE